MEPIFKSLFWMSAMAICYAYIGYPILVFFLSKLFGVSSKTQHIKIGRLPKVTILVAAYNEAEVIEERISNLLEVNYPRNRLRIVIASDGSSDDTVAIAAKYRNERLEVLDFRQRRGKSAVLNDAMGRINDGIVVLSDANTMMAADALLKLVSWFEDPAVGAVCGKLHLRDPDTGQNADGLYWRYENFLKRCEGRLRSVLGANGAIYAIRRSIVQPLPSDTLVDDLTLPLMAKMATGCQIVFEENAVAYEESAPSVGAEFHRRSRIGAGGFQALMRLSGLFHPRFGFTSLAFFSHKLLRWVSPFFLIGALLTSVLLAYDVQYRALLALQICFYLGAFAGSYCNFGGIIGRILRLPTLFTAVNLALIVGFFRWALGVGSGTWRRTPRTA